LKVKRFPCDPGPAAWNALLPEADPRAELTENITVDWLIIGAGFTGLSAARRLSELHSGDCIAVLDASRVAEGPAGRNSGFMIDVPHDLTSSDYSGDSGPDTNETILNRAGIDYASDAAEIYGMTTEAFSRSGKINGAITSRGAAHNAGYAEHLKNMNEPFERLSAEDMKSITGSDSYIDGLYSPGTAMIQPALFIRSLASGIESGNVEIFEQSPVGSLERSGNQWKAQTPRGSVSAKTVILAVNGHLESFGFYRRSLMHVFTYGSMTRAMSAKEVTQLGGKCEWALTPADPLGTTVRRISGTGGDRLIIRNRATFDPSLKVSDSRINTVARDHDQSFSDRFPMLKDVSMEYRWGGRLCLSRNNVSVFGEFDNGLFAACCQNGLGTAKGMISGKLIAEDASAIGSELLDYQKADARPVKLPPPPISTISANAVLRWGEFRAGREL